jgi:hypothetical protein
MKRPLGLFTVLSAFLAAAPLAAQERSPAPEGYSWQKLDEIKASFLLPNGWHFKAERVDRTLAYFLSEEDIDVKGEFETGLTLNVSHADQAQKKAVATLAMLAQAPGNELRETWETQAGALKGTGVRIHKSEKGADALDMVVLAIANSKTNALYLLIFESPEAQWKKAWEKGEKMMRLFVLDDEY